MTATVEDQDDLRKAIKLIQGMSADLVDDAKAMNKATALIEEQRAAIAVLVATLTEAKTIIKAWHEMGEADSASSVWDIYDQHSPEMRRINDVLAKHAPAPSQEDIDPTPWCHICRAMVKAECTCGDYADNN